MPTGPATTDANGIRLYGEDDLIAALWSDFMNLGLESVSDALGLLKDRVTTTEGALANPTTLVAPSAAARDAHWGTPTNATQRLALQNAGATTLRTDKAWTERYFAKSTDGGTNPGGLTVDGWYPITGAVPEGRLTRAATGLVNLANNAVTNADSILTVQEYVKDVTFTAGALTITQGGEYECEAAFSTLANATGARYAGLVVVPIATGVPAQFANGQGFGSAAGDTTARAKRKRRFVAGDIVRATYFQNSGAVLATTAADYGFLFDIRYLGPA